MAKYTNLPSEVKELIGANAERYAKVQRLIALMRVVAESGVASVRASTHLFAANRTQQHHTVTWDRGHLMYELSGSRFDRSWSDLPVTRTKSPHEVASYLFPAPGWRLAVVSFEGPLTAKLLKLERQLNPGGTGFISDPHWGPRDFDVLPAKGGYYVTQPSKGIKTQWFDEKTLLERYAGRLVTFHGSHLGKYDPRW